MKLNREARKEKQSHILEAAEQCFMRKGFHQTSMKDICTEAGMSAGNLYRYFDDKEAIIEAFATQELTWLRAAIGELPAVEGLVDAIVDTVVWTAATMMQDGKAELTAELFAEAGRNPKINAIYVKFNRQLVEEIVVALRTSIGNGIITPIISETQIARILIALVDGLVMQKIINPELDPAPLRPGVEATVRALLLSD